MGHRYFILLTVLSLIALIARVGGGQFSVPSPQKDTLWEAERAQLSGQGRVQNHPKASGGAFVEARGTVTLRFTVYSREPTRVRLIPILWRNSLRVPPRFFPFPLPTLFGPDIVVALGDHFYFTAPSSGRVGIVDAKAAALVGFIPVGGYLTDMVADRERGHLIVVDAWGGRVIALDPKRRQSVGMVRIKGAWALTLFGDRLFVASQTQKRLFVLDAETLKPLRSITLPNTPVHLSVTEGKNPTLIVHFEPLILRLPDFHPLPPDDLYQVPQRTSLQFGKRGQIGWKQFSITPRGVRMRWQRERGIGQKLIPIPQGRPVVLVATADRIFVGTQEGFVIALSARDGKPLKAVRVSDRPIDLLAIQGKVYATDPKNDRLVLLHPKTLSVLKTIPTPKEPIALESYTPRWWTETEMPLPWVFGACRKGKAIIMLFPVTDEVNAIIPVPFEPMGIRLLLPPDPGWWPRIPADRIVFSQTPRLVVAPAPFPLDVETLRPIDRDARRTYSRRHQSSLTLRDGTTILVTADNHHTLRFVARRGERVVRDEWLDTSPVTDTQGVAPVVDFGALQIAGRPWHRGIWMTPDQHIFLIADTEEFWHWNAPTLSLQKGRNTVTVTLKRYVQLDALRVQRVPPLTIKVIGEAPVNLPERYRAVFYADEPLLFQVILRSKGKGPFPVRLVVRIRNYMGEEVWVRVWRFHLNGPILRHRIAPIIRGTGTFTMTVKAETPEGMAKTIFRFLKLPELKRPRLLARRNHLLLARGRIARFPHVFRNYLKWLKESLSQPGFLPAGLTKAEILAKLPEGKRKLGAWRRYDLAWRMIATQLMALLAPPDFRDAFRKAVLQILRSGRTDSYVHFHHHGPFFPGAVAVFLDLVAADVGEDAEEVQKLREFLAKRLGDMNVFAWTLGAMSDPPTEKERKILWHLFVWVVNVERYFSVHAGKRGGTWWLNQRTACHCPFGAYSFAFLYLRHFLGEERFHYRTFVRGFLTHARLSRPLNDKRGLFGPPGPPGEPQRWITFALSRHPLTEAIYGWRKILGRIQREGSLKREELRQLFAFPDSANNNTPVPFVLPLGLALGWYAPDAPQVHWDELPPTLFFDAEGEVIMRSDYRPEATEVFFTCGLRDHVYRHFPTNLMVIKAGEPLLGSASLWGDHGCPSLVISRGNAWGNIVIIEPSDWRIRWRRNYFHPRGEEQALINRFSDATFRYLIRDQRLDGYLPAEGGFGGGLNFHGHTQSFLMREGHLIAFLTHPKFDYVAGDGTLMWKPEQARLVLRQVVFVRPDFLVVYDRVKLGERASRAYWLAATGFELVTKGNEFFVRSGNAQMHGIVLYPPRPHLLPFNPATSPKYHPLFDPQATGMQVLEIHPPTLRRTVEFLIVMRVGINQTPPLNVTPSITDERFSLTIRRDKEKVIVTLHRNDVAGGSITIEGKGKREIYELRERVDDSYRYWRNDPRYQRWAKEARFDFLMGHNGREHSNLRERR